MSTAISELTFLINTFSIDTTIYFHDNPKEIKNIKEKAKPDITSILAGVNKLYIPKQMKRILNQIKIIGAGFGRTGTTTMRFALNELGYKCYHMKDVVQHKHDKFWYNYTKNLYKYDVCYLNNELFNKYEYNACMDWPTTSFFDRIYFSNPNAKVILTVRDNNEKWYNSVNKTIYASYLKKHKNKDTDRAKFLKALLYGKNGFFEGKFEKDKERMKRKYDEHIIWIKKIIPKDNLLIFNVKDGWIPLCEFLDIEIPIKEYPDGKLPVINDMNTFRKKRNMKPVTM